MNRVRRRMDDAKDVMRLEQERRNKETPFLKDIVLQKPRCFDLHLPPSPLGLSNYDALDLDEGVFDEDDAEDIDTPSTIYSDFNIMNPVSTNEDDDYEVYLDKIDGISPENLPDTPPPPPEDSIAEMLLREDGKGESIFVQIR